MKKIPLFLFVALCVCFCSCSKDKEELIVGTWQVTQTNFISNEDHQVVSEYDSSDGDWLFCFKEDHTGWVLADQDSMPFSYVLSGNNLTFSVQELPDGVSKDQGVYELTMTIEQLDENTLHTYVETVMRDIEGTYHYHMKKR